MRSKVFLLILSCLTLTSCGYQGWTRYPCQEFENWKKAECNPPQCYANSQCTKDMLPEGYDETPTTNP
jgi:hypothetical protein